MNGLMRNNFYSCFENVKWVAVVMIILGGIAVLADNDSRILLICYLLVSMQIFSLAGIAGMRRESSSKWNQYKLSLPVRRRDIVRSYLVSHVLWLLAGILLASICMGAFILIHGVPFDRNTDVLMVYTAGICLNLVTGAFYYPLYFAGGDERNELALSASLFLAVGIFAGLVSVMNWYFAPKPTLQEILAGAGVMILTAVVLYLVSYPVSVQIMKKRQY